MANSFNREEIVLFEQVLEKFDSDNRIAMEAARFSQPGTTMQRTGDTIWRPQPMISTTTTGLDITSSIGSITQLAVPATLSTIENVAWEEDVQEMRDPLYRDRKSTSASQALSAAINRAMANNIAIWGSLTIPVTAALTGYDDVSLADALMVENDVLGNQKTMVLNPRDYNGMAGNLASRTLMPRSEKALDDTNLGPIASFNTFKTSFGPTLLLATTDAVFIAGAGQRFVPASTTTATTGETENQDNRTMVLNVDDGTGSAPSPAVKSGDKFTIAGVNALSHINKQDTGQLKTFTVISTPDSLALTIAPPIIVGDGTSDAEDDYANVTAVPADDAVITFLNTATVQTNPFFMNDSIEVFSGNLAFGEDMAGVAVMRMSTQSGTEIIFAKQGDVLTGKAAYRLTIFFGVTNLNPEMNGILIGNQI